MESRTQNFNSMQNNELKLIPSGITKHQVCQMYPKESESYLRQLCQHIQIENNPHLPERVAKLRHKFSRKETEKLIEVLGTPSGYQNKFK